MLFFVSLLMSQLIHCTFIKCHIKYCFFKIPDILEEERTEGTFKSADCFFPNLTMWTEVLNGWRKEYCGV